MKSAPKLGKNIRDMSDKELKRLIKRLIPLLKFKKEKR
jgi:hypothetical protein